MSDMSDFEQIKPCPFCGSHPNEGSVGSSVPGMEDCGYLYIECRQCNGTSGKPFIGVHGDDKEVLRGIWNTRAAKQSMQCDSEHVAIYEQDTNHLQELMDTDMAKGWRWMRKDFARGDKLYTHAPDSAARIAELEARKDAAYFERNQCVALIARMALALGHDVAVTKTVIDGWSEDWHGCIYIELPTGQVSWHFHDSQAYLFEGLPSVPAVWDGHDTPEKYRRVNDAFIGVHQKAAISQTGADASLNIKGGAE